MKYAIACCLLFLTTIALAQPAKKKDDKPPTKAEMDAMMQQMEAAMKDLDPNAKRMMDSLGIKMPDLKNMPKKPAGISDAQMKMAWEEENRIVPKKDAVRIASISKTPLATAGIPAYLAAVHTKVSVSLKPAAKAKAEEIYQAVKATGPQPLAMGNTAAGLWMTGKAQMAIYLMGKACMDNPAVANNLNNYASMLTMANMPETAIPLLENLNKSYPQNSTILNNLGQAWYGLGDIDMAVKYIDSTLRFAALHPQANATKSAIEESKGNLAAAKEAAIKAAKAGYSQEKEERLRQLGIPLDDKVSGFPFKPENDALGLSAFKRPDYPTSVSQCIVMQPMWATFKQQCVEASDKLGVPYKQALAILQQAQQQRINTSIQQVKFAQQNPDATVPATPEPLYARQAQLKYRERFDFWEKQYYDNAKKKADFMLSMAPRKTRYEKDIETLQEEDLEQTGEGKPNKDFCPKYQAVANAYLQEYNTGMEKFDNAALDILKRQANEVIYLLQYVQWPEEYEVSKLQFKLRWLKEISDANYQSITRYKCLPTKPGKAGELREFDDINCKYHSTLNLIVQKITIDCSRMTTEINTPFLKLGLKQDMNKETFGDQFMNGSVEIGVSVGPSVKAGPLKAEASIGAGARAEFDRTGITDFIVKGSATVGTGVEVDGKGAGIEVGVEGQVSLISGKASVGGAGLFGK